MGGVTSSESLQENKWAALRDSLFAPLHTILCGGTGLLNNYV